MASNDRIILNQVLEQQRQNIASSLDPTQYFEVFTAEQILKDYDLSYDEIESGIVAGGGDGGIDSYYVFVNGELLHEDSDFTDLRKDITIEVFIIQSKTSAGFSEVALDRFIAATDDLFDLSKPLDELQSVYNEALLMSVDRFRSTYQALASKFPKLRISYYYATKGDEVHPNVQRKVSKLETSVKGYFSAAQFEFSFIGAGKLLELARRTPTTSYELKLSENPISSSGDVAFVCLVSLRDFYNFMTDNQGHLIRQIFEANVRDYQGKTQVNEQIQASLQEREAEDFWWLNNGITILASRATLSGKIITIENPEIVNGLQTSTEIYNYFAVCNTEDESRNLLIRVVVPNVDESRDRIIKATNSQTTIPPASLRATDRIHRDIEEYLKPFGLYYDRRKNFYKNEGKPINRIISIPQMAQAVMAISLKRPDSARARPSSLIKRDRDYLKLFNTDYPIEIYRASAEILKKTESYLNSHEDTLSAADKNNLKFYIAMAVAQIVLRKFDPSEKDISSLAGAEIDDGLLSNAYTILNDAYSELGRTDKVAKGPDLVEQVKQKLKELYPPQQG
jgi:hypothetical protein